jgi:hypothetical protein
MNTNTLICDPVSRRVLWACAGPADDGSCPRVAIGEAIACAGCSVIPAGIRSRPYLVPERMTLCPRTLVAMLAVPSDSAFLDG